MRDLDEIKFRHGDAFHSYVTGFNNITGKIILPVSIGGRNENAIFDTGSSMFEMKLPLDLWEMVTCSPITNAGKKMAIESWGSSIEIFGASTNATLNVAGKSIPITDVYAWPTYDMLPVIGNKLFLNNLIVVDKRKQHFSVF